MAVLPTLKLRHKRNGAIRIVNQTTYALNLGAWGDWDVISMRSGDASDKEVRFEQKQEIIEKIRVNDPKSPAFGDAQRAYEARTVTINTNATPDPETKGEYAATGTEPEPDPTPQTPVERVVPTIGGSQTVKISKKPGRPSKANQDEVL